MYVSAADNDYVGVTGTFLGTHSQGVWASAFEGELVSVTDLLADSLALTGSATLDGLTAPSSSRRGRIVRARLYSVQTGLAQTMSKCPGGNSV